MREHDTEDEHRNGDDEACEWARRAHVEQFSLVRQRSPNPDEGAERAYPHGDWKEVRECRVETVEAASNIVPSLVREQDEQ